MRVIINSQHGGHFLVGQLKLFTKLGHVGEQSRHDCRLARHRPLKRVVCFAACKKRVEKWKKKKKRVDVRKTFSKSPSVFVKLILRHCASDTYSHVMSFGLNGSTGDDGRSRLRSSFTSCELLLFCKTRVPSTRIVCRFGSDTARFLLRAAYFQYVNSYSALRPFNRCRSTPLSYDFTVLVQRRSTLYL